MLRFPWARRPTSPANAFPWVFPWLGAGFVIRFSFSLALGVGHTTTVASDGERRFASAWHTPRRVSSFGVGQSFTCPVNVGRSRPLVPRSRWYCPRSSALGVDQSPDKPRPISLVRRADRPSTHHERPNGVSERFHFSEYPVSPASAESRNILKKHPSRSASDPGQESSSLKEQTALGSVQARTLTRAADVLAGEARSPDIEIVRQSGESGGGGEP
ncbi:unnamed protein product, partial [marine sediment metagenome]